MGKQSKEPGHDLVMLCNYCCIGVNVFLSLEVCPPEGISSLSWRFGTWISRSIDYSICVL
jgi:hypothetical protein